MSNLPQHLVDIKYRRFAFGKPERGNLDLRTLMQWPGGTNVQAALHHDCAYLAPEILNTADFSQMGWIVLEEQVPPEVAVPPQNSWVLSVEPSHQTRMFRRNSRIHCNFFEIVATDGGVPELHLKFDTSLLGYPERDDFRVGILRPGVSLDVRINGKKDNTLSSGKARTYLEVAVLITYLGTFTSAKPLTQIPPDLHRRTAFETKYIDLRKLLW